MFIAKEIQTAAYLFASILFILSLSGLSSQESAKRGVLYGIVGMIVAIFATVLGKTVEGHVYILAAIAVASLIGILVARKVEMTAMPQLVAILHSFVGLAAVLVGVGSYLDPETQKLTGAEHTIHLVEVFVGIFIGAITFTGSIIAWGKLDGKVPSKPWSFAGLQIMNLILLLICVGLGAMFCMADGTSGMLYLMIMTAIASFIGVVLVMAIGGGDMPVVVSMLNSYSGWAAAGIGFSLNNQLLIIAGSLVGSSGAILSYIMCKAMNRSFFSVILGGFGAAEGAASTGGEERTVRSGSADDAAFLMANAESVIIVPGYGLAVARAQHAVKELAHKLIAKGVTVRYAIHPVAGRMPGHMNVLLAEAEVPYDQVLEMDDINSDFGTTDVVLVLGANDVVNPLAHEKGSPIYGMPILDVAKSRTILVNKRSMAAGYAGLDNPLFYMDKTMMVFGDAKKVVEDIVKGLD